VNNFDVIIVGCGPTGATLAGLLGQAGIRVAVFDRLPDLYPLPRAIGLDHETMRIVQELGLGDRMQAHVAPYRPSEYRGMDGELIKRLDTLPEPHPLGWAPNYVFDQPAFERVLRARLAELPSVKVFLEAEVQSTGQDDAMAWADVRLSGQESATRFSARFLVACDGGASPVRKRLGIELEDLDFNEPWLVVDAVVSDEKLAQLPQTQVQYCEAARPSTFVVGPGNHRRWEIMLLDGDSLSPEFPEEELWPLLKRWIAPGDARLWRAAAYRFHGLVANEWRRGRILLAGDSAHMTPPFMAQGMVGGMRDAHNLAWKLARVMGGHSPATLLDTYMEERRPHVKQTILAAMGLGRIICERDPQRALERDRRLRAQHGGEVKTEYRQNMIPNLVQGIVAQDTPGAGSLFPQPSVTRPGGGSVLLDDRTGPRIRLVVAGEQGSADIARLEASARTLGACVVVLGERSSQATGEVLWVQEDGAVIAPWLAGTGSRIALVRPDHYVYGTASGVDDALALIERFKRQLAGDA
jgi:3-(3-hydroxy-phenyl)propionate hydroxylase